jgi:hypothetical protein
VGGRVVVMEPVVVPNFWSFSSHIFTQESQNSTVKVRVDCNVRRNKFTVNNPLHVKKRKTSMLFLNSGPAVPFLFLVIVGFSTAMIVALFLGHNRKFNFFFTRYDARDSCKSWVFISLLS